MDLYSSFSGFVELIASPVEIIVDENIFGEHPWLKLLIEPVFLYGSLPRPPDLQFTVVCMCLLPLLSRLVASGKFFVGDLVEKMRTSEVHYVHKEGEIWLNSYKEFVSSTSVPRQGELTMMILDWLSQRYQSMLIHLSPTQVYEGVQFLYKEKAKPVAVTLNWKSKVAAALLTNTDLALLLHGDGSIVGQEHVDTSGSLNIFDFGSLTRPPEAHCVFSFKSLKFT